MFECVRAPLLQHLLQSREVSSRFKDIGLEAMSTFFTMAGRDAKPFCLAFDTVVTFVEDPGNWDVMKEELTERRVVDITFYDVVLDFTLLDAFDDLDNLPSTIVSVLQNRWLTDGMKESALNAGIWTMIKAKKSMLKVCSACAYVDVYQSCSVCECNVCLILKTDFG
jgi:hypothetical protein